ncbi:MAG: sigma 54-interacting transcriptional regulator, partial [Planctomycetota bacterium]
MDAGVDPWVDPQQASQLLLSDYSTERILSELLNLWIRGGVIRSGSVYLKRVGGWARLAQTPRGWCVLGTPEADSGENSNVNPKHRTLLRLLSMAELPSLASPSCQPHREGRLLCYSLGSPHEEIARLVLEPVRQKHEPHLPQHLFTSLTLFLRAVRDRERGETMALTGDLSRRLFLARDPKAKGESSWLELRHKFPGLIGRSRKLRLALALAAKAAPRNASILILGESGTGKELVARAVHRLSARKAKPFVCESCAAFSPSLLEAEIFGSEKGAFTGAVSTRPGMLERSHEGTLFLDEIGEMGAALQSKLLRVLQEREVRRVGGSTLIPVDFRLITATHRDLDQEVAAGRFRTDLLFRIDVIKIQLPPLRERREDIPMLVRHFVADLGGELGRAIPVVQ